MWTKDEVMSEDISTTYTPKIISSDSANTIIHYVAYGNNKFVANYNNLIYSSENGTLWTKVQTAGSTGITYVYTVVYYGGMFLIGANSGIYYIPSSGILVKATGASGVDCIGYSNGTFVALSNSRGAIGAVKSADGMTWTTWNPGISEQEPGKFTFFSCNNKIFCDAMEDGFLYVKDSIDSSWVKTNISVNDSSDIQTVNRLNRAIYIDGKYYFCFSDGLYISQDGITFEKHAFEVSPISIAKNNNCFMITLNNKTVLSTTDFINYESIKIDDSVSATPSLITINNEILLLGGGSSQVVKLGVETSIIETPNDMFSNILTDIQDIKLAISELQ